MFGKDFSVATQKLRHVLSKFSASIKAHGEFTGSNELCQRPGFLDLPVEIILMIQDLLPLASAVSLALARRGLLQLQGNKLLRSINLPVNADQRKTFLLSLQKDLLSDWQLCHPCLVFHPLQKEVNPHVRWRHDRKDCVQISGCVSPLPGLWIRYEHAQLVMNRYRFGTLHEDDLGMLSFERDSLIYGHRVITPSIEDGGLAINMTATLRLIDSWDARKIRWRLPAVCIHDLEIHSFPQYILEDTIHCQLNHEAKQSCIDCAQWKSCPTCHTRFYVEIQRINTAEIVVQLYTRRWLGPCETPMDPYWSRHCRRFYGPWASHRDTAEGERGSVVVAKGECVVQ
ncbi:MAG: hypothetical protein Q9223_003621 [Gallowayella weberi]